MDRQVATHVAKGLAAGPEEETSFRDRTTHIKRKCDDYISASFDEMTKKYPKSSNEDLWRVMEERKNRLNNLWSTLGIEQEVASGTRLSEPQQRRVIKVLEDVKEDLSKVKDILLRNRNNWRMIEASTQEEGHDSELYQSLKNIGTNLEIDLEKDTDRSLSLKERNITFSKDGIRVPAEEFKA
ncbi:hypothetical protein CFIO01_05065 [Colletotrichum fioriniae PJ7]|uniref:Uncharacterized protein n=1 Tax=Colletotrichum fioriniae PJ7 TaxID=1445577 RepID=A0A010R9A4_9PEZI|nr:hypothetical protein CFIO01_05065 [Colletotrichum fioriniae PJ7]